MSAQIPNLSNNSNKAESKHLEVDNALPLSSGFANPIKVDYAQYQAEYEEFRTKVALSDLSKGGSILMGGIIMSPDVPQIRHFQNATSPTLNTLPECQNLNLIRVFICPESAKSAFNLSTSPQLHLITFKDGGSSEFNQNCSQAILEYLEKHSDLKKQLSEVIGVFATNTQFISSEILGCLGITQHSSVQILTLSEPSLYRPQAEIEKKTVAGNQNEHPHTQHPEIQTRRLGFGNGCYGAFFGKKEKKTKAEWLSSIQDHFVLHLLFGMDRGGGKTCYKG